MIRNVYTSSTIHTCLHGIEFLGIHRKMGSDNLLLCGDIGGTMTFVGFDFLR